MILNITFMDSKTIDHTLGNYVMKCTVQFMSIYTHIIGSTSWPKKKNFQYHLSGVVVDLLEVQFLPLGKKTIQPFSRAGGIQAKWPAKYGLVWPICQSLSDFHISNSFEKLR